MRFVTPIDDVSGLVGRRAAQYVRISTGMQKYSFDNQVAANSLYAARRGLEIVRTYHDEDRSGLIINNREGLQNLLIDVEAGKVDFQLILVYDISRWGRFQDADESAYYEFICKRAGVKVAYCAEQFENDGSLFSTMMKMNKRVMAGEFSREKSVLISAGACRTARMGFKQGGTAGFGLQRVLIDQYGNPRCVLQRGDRKYFNSDRVVLSPGKPTEVQTVQRIFRSFVVAGKSELTIARELNEEGIPNEFGRPWRMLAVRRLLTCEKYVGSYVYNRKSGKLKRRRRPNPPEQWIRRDNAFEAIVDPEMFARARAIFARRPSRLNRIWPSNDDILARLKALLEQRGRLSCVIIDAAEDVPSNALYRTRFGSLRKAYDLIGYDPDKRAATFDARRAAVLTVRKLQSELTAAVQRSGVRADFVPPTSHRCRAIITVNSILTISIYLARCQNHLPGKYRWYLRRKIGSEADMVLIVRMNETNTGALDFHFLPSNLVMDGKFSLWERPLEKLQPHRFLETSSLIPPIWRALSEKIGRAPLSLNADAATEFRAAPATSAQPLEPKITGRSKGRADHGPR